MPRILADLPDDDLRWLDQKAVEQGRSRASLLREAVSTFKARAASDAGSWLDQGFGLWTRHGITVDPHDYERRRRVEWTRPWDDDYEEVRAESPDLFSRDDDKERAHYLALTRGRSDGRKSDG